MKDGVRIINCARGELIDQAALIAALTSGKVAGAGLDVFDPEPPKEGDPILSAPNLLASPHIGGSTEEAQEIVGIRIARQLVDYLTQGVAVAAVNMPAMSPEQFRAVGPWLDVAERLGIFGSYIADGNPRALRITYRGKIAEMNTQLIRNAAIAGMLGRSLPQKPNIVNAMPLASQRGLMVEERHDKRVVYVDSIRVELDTDAGVTTVEGSLVLDKVRLLQVDGIPCEAALTGHLLYLKNRDVPGVIGHIGNVLGKNSINIANFSLGRQEVGVPGLDPLGAVAILETDAVVAPGVLDALKEHKAILVARTVELPR